MPRRPLTSEEIDDILSVVRPYHKLQGEEWDDTFEHAVFNVRAGLRKQLISVTIADASLIPTLKAEIDKQYRASLLSPGEMVGVIAASSIGEQNTQASLNSFHSSGAFKANLTGGLARLSELMNATENLKTPSLTIYFNGNVEQKLSTIRSLAFTKLIKVELENLIESIEVTATTDVVKDVWYPFVTGMYSINLDGCAFRLRLKLSPLKLWRHQLRFPYIIQRIEDSIDVTNHLTFVWSHESIGVLDVWIKPEITSFEMLTEDESIRVAIARETEMLFYINKTILPILFTVKLSGVEGIEECYYTELPSKEWRIDTKGGKLKSLLRVECVDGLRCTSNDMHEIHRLFGIEAVKQLLRHEFNELFKVNQRHLELLIDSMTVSGSIARVTRNGIDRKQVGTIAKASFEQPVDNFLISATTGEKDPLKGVSAAVTVGKLADIGTGFMEVYLDLNKLNATLKEPEKPQHRCTELTAQELEDLQDMLFTSDSMMDDDNEDVIMVE